MHVDTDLHGCTMDIDTHMQAQHTHSREENYITIGGFSGRFSMFVSARHYSFNKTKADWGSSHCE